MLTLIAREMTSADFQAWYARLKAIDPTLTNTNLASRLGVDQPRIGKWLRGEVRTSGYLHLALERLEQIMVEEQRPKKRRRTRMRPDRHGRSIPVRGGTSDAVVTPQR